jgi:prevent-host-death family protein
MKSLSLSEARRTLPSLADDVVERGEEIVVTRRGKPILRLVPVAPEPPAMGLRGLPVQISDDFDDPVEQNWEALER